VQTIKPAREPLNATHDPDLKKFRDVAVATLDDFNYKPQTRFRELVQRWMTGDRAIKNPKPVFWLCRFCLPSEFSLEGYQELRVLM
jgi:hypothetical protein